MWQDWLKMGWSSLLNSTKIYWVLVHGVNCAWESRSGWDRPGCCLQEAYSPRRRAINSAQQRGRDMQVLGEHRQGQGVSVDFSEEPEYIWDLHDGREQPSVWGRGWELSSKQRAVGPPLDLQFVQGTGVPAEELRGIQPCSALHWHILAHSCLHPRACFSSHHSRPCLPSHVPWVC